MRGHNNGVQARLLREKYRTFSEISDIFDIKKNIVILFFEILDFDISANYQNFRYRSFYHPDISLSILEGRIY